MDLILLYTHIVPLDEIVIPQLMGASALTSILPRAMISPRSLPFDGLLEAQRGHEHGELGALFQLLDLGDDPGHENPGEASRGSTSRLCGDMSTRQRQNLLLAPLRLQASWPRRT
jgi:hypothetical protein